MHTVNDLHLGTRATRRRLVFSLVVTCGVVIAEVAGGMYSHSVSLVSDAAHVFTDVLAISLSLFALNLSAKSHQGIMTYGYHRAEVLAALANGIVLAAISVWVVFEAFDRLARPQEVNSPVVIGVASIGLVANLSIMFALRKDANKSINVKSAFIHVVYDAVSSFAVIVAGLIAFFTGITTADPIVAIIIAGLIARSSYSIVKGSTHILLEGAPADIDMTDVSQSISGFPGVVDVHDLHIWSISSGMHALSGHLVVKDQMLSQSSLLLTDINKLLAEKYGIHHTTLQLENEKEVSFKRTGRLS